MRRKTVKGKRIDEIVAGYAHLSNQWLVWVHGLDNVSIDDVLRAAPWLDFTQDGTLQILIDGQAVVLFEDEGTAREFFNDLPSDDNPPPKDGIRFYALLISPVNGVLTEST